jgi:ATP-dependent DNA helicase RecG
VHLQGGAQYLGREPISKRLQRSFLNERMPAHVACEALQFFGNHPTPDVALQTLEDRSHPPGSD